MGIDLLHAFADGARHCAGSHHLAVPESLRNRRALTRCLSSAASTSRAKVRRSSGSTSRSSASEAFVYDGLMARLATERRRPRSTRREIAHGIDSTVAHELVEIGRVEPQELAHLVVTEAVLQHQLPHEAFARTQVGSGRLDAEPVRRIYGRRRSSSGLLDSCNYSRLH